MSTPMENNCIDKLENHYAVDLMYIFLVFFY